MVCLTRLHVAARLLFARLLPARLLPTGLVLAAILTAPGGALAQALPGMRAPTREQVVAKLPALAALAQRAVAAGEVPGVAIAVVLGDETLFVEGFGLRQTGRPEPVGPDTVFQVASLSKAVTATVVAALVGAGLVDWDARVADLDPAFRLSEPYPTAAVTVRDFLNHRSGLPGSAGDDLEDLGFNRDAILPQLRLVRPSSSFRAGYAYSNFGFTEGAIAAARPTGKPWEIVAREHLFDPLGMNATSMVHRDFLARPDRAALHVRVADAWVARLTRDPDAQAPAGGVSSSARDLARWLRLVVNAGQFEGRQRIPSAALAEMHKPLMARGPNPVTGGASFYGLGWNVEYGRHGTVWGHAGAFSVGAQTLVAIHPGAKLGLVVLTNGFPSGVPEGLADSFADLVFDGQVSRSWLQEWGAAYGGLFAPSLAAAKAANAAPADATGSLPLAAYMGRYANAYAGEAVVAAVDGALTLTLGPQPGRTYPLRHVDRDRFASFPDAEMPDRPSAIRFAIGRGGQADAVTVDALDSNGLGTLARVPD